MNKRGHLGIGFLLELPRLLQIVSSRESRSAGRTMGVSRRVPDRGPELRRIPGDIRV